MACFSTKAPFPPTTPMRRLGAAGECFHFDRNSGQDGPFHLIGGGWNEGMGASVPREIGSCFTIEFIAEGCATVELDGRSYLLRPGCVFFCEPRETLTICPHPGDRLLNYYACFAGQPADWPNPPKSRLGRMIHLSAPGEFRKAFDQLVRLGRLSPKLACAAAGLLVEVLFLSMQERSEAGEISDRGAKATFERCRDYLDAHYLEINRIESLAKACYVNGPYLSRLFRRFADISPLQYLREAKMNWAARKLDSSTMMVREIADDLHMDPFQFSRAFKRVHGISPTKFASFGARVTTGAQTMEITLRRSELIAAGRT